MGTLKAPSRPNVHAVAAPMLAAAMSTLLGRRSTSHIATAATASEAVPQTRISRSLRTSV
jgi:hypothetical protein